MAKDAVLQMEINTSRWALTADQNDFIGGFDESPWKRIYNIVKTAACDTVHNGGTLVIVSDIERSTLTIVQRDDVDDLTGHGPS